MDFRLILAFYDAHMGETSITLGAWCGMKSDKLLHSNLHPIGCSGPASEDKALKQFTKDRLLPL